LIGPWPEAEAIYRERAPLYHADQIRWPVLLLQGLEDAVVPSAQAEHMVAGLEQRGVPYAYVPFEGEQHGWRRAETIRAAHDAELSFYAQIFGFAPSGDVQHLKIKGWLAPAQLVAGVVPKRSGADRLRTGSVCCSRCPRSLRGIPRALQRLDGCSCACGLAGPHTRPRNPSGTRGDSRGTDGATEPRHREELLPWP
jgi:Prolyl oligopeptidase family